MVRRFLIWLLGPTRKEYFIDYEIGKDTYCVTVVADSWGDAEIHLLSIKRTGRVSGEIQA